MKRFILFLICFLCVNTANATNDISFIYINGSNNNDIKMKTWYEEGVNKLHPVLKKTFENDEIIKAHYKNGSGLNIEEKPVIFFWGDKSKKNLDYVKYQLDISKAVSSAGAYMVRNLLTQYMHDAIWVQKNHNMLPILDELNEVVKLQVSQGKEVILYGYSAGTFVTYEYLFNNLRYVNLYDMFSSQGLDEEFLDFVKENPREDTCISALSYSKSGIGTFSQDGQVIINQNKENLKANYLALDEKTELYCAPKTGVRGVVNFASPLVLFYSDLSDPEYKINYYNKLMTKYIFENGVYWLTINFKEDPLGFPTTRNLTLTEIQNRLGMDIKNPTGIIYDDSGVWSKRFFALAHTSYWTARKTFSKAIVKSFINGYKFQYDPEFQAKVIKKHSKKSEL